MLLYAAWILLFAYVVFSLYTAKEVMEYYNNRHGHYPYWADMGTFYVNLGWPFIARWKRGCMRPDGRKVRPLRPLYKLLKLLMYVVVFVFSPLWHVGILIYIFVIDPIRQKFVEKANRKYAEEQAAQAERIRKWKEENPPVLYYNRDQGVTEVVTKESYVRIKGAHLKQVRNGTAVHGKTLLMITDGYIYVHASAKHVPEDFKSGMLSDFDELKELAKQGLIKLERRKDIFVHFVSDDVIEFSEQAKKATPKDTGYPIECRAAQARNKLLDVRVPQEVLNPAKQ